MAHLLDRPAQHAVRSAIVERNPCAAYIREGMRLSGYAPEVADLADLLRGDRDALELNLSVPEERQAAEFFVVFLSEHQHNIKFVRKFDLWRS